MFSNISSLGEAWLVLGNPTKHNAAPDHGLGTGMLTATWWMRNRFSSRETTLKREDM